jgi:hypothetical protein
MLDLSLVLNPTWVFLELPVWDRQFPACPSDKSESPLNSSAHREAPEICTPIAVKKNLQSRERQ